MNELLTDSELDEINARLCLTTKGPWTSYIEGRDHLSGSNFIMTGFDENRGEDIELIGASIADQDFIAAARQDIPKLIAEIKRLRSIAVL
jgi:hypothetical protein